MVGAYANRLVKRGKRKPVNPREFKPDKNAPPVHSHYHEHDGYPMHRHIDGGLSLPVE